MSLMNAIKSTKMINFDVLMNITDQLFINTKEKESYCIADVLLQETISAKKKLSMNRIIDISDLTIIKENIYFK